jgi:hypothetical protein
LKEESDAYFPLTTKEFEMVDEVVNEKRREFLSVSGQVLSGVVVGGSAMATPPATGSAQSSAAKEPAVIGYPNKQG